MIVDIPTDQTGLTFYEQVTQLDGVPYRLRFQWNSREQSWYLFIADHDDAPITSAKLVPEWNLLRRVVDARKPPGVLFLHDTSGEGKKAGFTDLGGRCVLVYIDAAEVAAAP